MAVQTLTSVELTDDSDGSHLTVDERRDTDESNRWHVRHDNTSGLYVTAGDLRGFAHALLALVGDEA